MASYVIDINSIICLIVSNLFPNCLLFYLTSPIYLHFLVSLLQDQLGLQTRKCNTGVGLRTYDTSRPGL